jgi:hypothetical protein
LDSKPLRIAFLTTIPNDAVPFAAAVKEVNSDGDKVNCCVQSVAHARDFNDFGDISHFTSFARKAHVLIAHLMGSSPEVFRIIAEMKTVGVPCFVSSAASGRNQELRKHCTVGDKDYQVIYTYLSFGGKKNFSWLFSKYE